MSGKTERSITNVVVLDSGWEGSEAFHLDHSDKVKSWVKNDHLGLEIYYQDEGVVRKYRPDFLVRLVSGTNLLLETKGKPGAEADSKEQAAAEWVEAVNAAGRFGNWRHERCDKPQRVLDVVESA